MLFLSAVDKAKKLNGKSILLYYLSQPSMIRHFPEKKKIKLFQQFNIIKKKGREREKFRSS